MKFPRLVRIAVAALPFGLCFGGEVLAHQVIPGVTGFPALLLHPLVIPDFLLCLFAAALVVARTASIPSLAWIAAFCISIPIGSLAQDAVLSVPNTELLPLSLAGLMALIVAVSPEIDMSQGILAILLLGFAVGLGIFPEGSSRWDLYQAVIAAMLSGAIIIFAVGWPLSKLRSHWGKVLIRVAGAWIAAIAMMVLAFDLRQSISAIL